VVKVARKKLSDEEKERLKRLRKEAQRIIRRMDQHKLFGFILHHKGKKAIPLLMELWGEGMMQEEDETDETTQTEEEPKVENVVEKSKTEEQASPDDLIELVTEDTKKGR
jgi:hypothetical protein